MTGTSQLEFRHLALGDTPSTNTECLERARAGEEGGLWITARRQTAGRGRRGRTWISEPGNLYASLLLLDPAEPKDLGSLPMAVSLAVLTAVRAALPLSSAEIKLKWPNDVLINRNKTSGILLEAETLPSGRQAVVIGCGINVTTKPDNPLYPVTCLSEEGSALSADELFAHLYLAMQDMLALWDRGRGLAAIIELWRQNCVGMGERATINLPDRSISGIFTGIDATGKLMLDTGSGALQTFAAGDVFFG